MTKDEFKKKQEADRVKRRDAAFILGRIWEAQAIYTARKQIKQHLPTSLIKHWSLRAYNEGNLTEKQRDAIWRWLDM